MRKGYLAEKFRIIRVEDYAQYVGEPVVERILKKAEPLQGYSIAHVNSAYYGGGVAEMLASLTLLMNCLGMKTGWRLLRARQDFFNITKKIHNALQGAPDALTRAEKDIYEHEIYENVLRNRLDHDIVVVHDPQPVGLIRHYRRRGPWIWRCHIDLTAPNPAVWEYLAPYASQYDAIIVSLHEYKQNLANPQFVFLPAIDPFCEKNLELTAEEVDEIIGRYDIPTDLPIVLQVSRFDKWKDPKGVIEAARLAREEVDFRLIMVGNVAQDDPEAQLIYDSIKGYADDRTRFVWHDSDLQINALQRKATVVVQKSIREGFGLTVTEAMWKRRPVIGGNVGGIRYQIEDGANGFLVNDVPECAARIVQLLKDATLRRTLGERAWETVRERFLMTRVLEQYLELFNAFETSFQVRPPPSPGDSDVPSVAQT